MRYKQLLAQPSPKQQPMLLQQLGREPEGMTGIAVQNSQGTPLVLQMQSLVQNKPFPTLYWLCSKELYQAIAQIETAGAVKELELELQHNPELLKQHLQDQQRYVDLRQSFITPQQQEKIAQLGFLHLYSEYGIGGIRHWDKVRCLHMHYAYHLAQGSVVGEWLEENYAQFELAKVADHAKL